MIPCRVAVRVGWLGPPGKGLSSDRRYPIPKRDGNKNIKSNKNLSGFVTGYLMQIGGLPVGERKGAALPWRVWRCCWLCRCSWRIPLCILWLETFRYRWNNQTKEINVNCRVCSGEKKHYSSPHVSRLLHVVERKVDFGIFAQRAAKVAHRQVQVMSCRTHNLRILPSTFRWQCGIPLFWKTKFLNFNVFFF